ncbi:MAG: PAS domain-containing sensor histidine kinase [Halorientalis sp.]
MATSATHDRVRVLYLGADPFVANVAASFLQEGDPRIEARAVATERSVREGLRGWTPDCVATEGDVLAELGMAVLEDLCSAEGTSVPLVVFADDGTRALSVEPLSAVGPTVRHGGPENGQRRRAARVLEAVERAETEADPRAAWFGALAANPSVLLFVADAAGRVTYVSDPVEEWLGYAPSELSGRPVETLLPDGESEEVRWLQEPDAQVTDDRHEGRWFGLDLRHADGHTVPVSLSLARVPVEGDAHVAGVARRQGGDDADTDRLAWENEKLREYRTLVETVPDGVFELDADCRMLYVNEEWADIVGRERTDLEWRPFTDLVENGPVPATAVDDYLDLLSELLSSENDREEGRFTVRMTPAGADAEHVYETHVRLLPYEEAFRGTAVVVYDVTDHERHQAELEARNQRLDEFAALVSHDLRNPLDVAKNRLEAARRDGTPEDHLGHAEEALDRMESLIDDLLELAREGRRDVEVEPRSLERVARTCWLSLDPCDATLETPAERAVVVDESGLERLLENVFENALEHGGDDVTVTVGDLPDGFYVADDGRGIPPAEREDVFEAGYTTAADGTGFGMRIVERIAGIHGWEVAATESEAGGARIEVTGVETTA